MSPTSAVPSPASLKPVTAVKHTIGGVRGRMQTWFASRLPLTDTVTLTQGTVYILPSRAGLMLGATLIVLLVASINYQLNLGYLLTFLLAGSAIAGMYVSHGTLRGLTLHLAPPTDCFMTESASLEIVLTNIRSRPRYGIGLSLYGSEHWVWADVPAQGSATVRLTFPPQARGRQRAPTLTAQTRYPMGTFRVWTVWRPAATVLVYPAPEPRPPPLPPGEPRPGGARATPARSDGEFDSVRAWRRGDPMKLVVWKKFAKTGELVSRDGDQAQRHELWLDFARVGLTSTEARLSRLCAWVLAADRLGVDYGLRLPATEIPPSSGPAHRRNCLEALALC